MITNLMALPPSPYVIEIKKGALITATIEPHVGGTIKIMVFPSAEIGKREYINTPHYQGTIHMVFTHKEAIKNKPPSDSSRLNEHKITNGRFLITKYIAPNDKTAIHDDNVIFLTSIIEGDGDVLRHDLKTALIGKYLPVIGIKFTDAKWATTKIIMETIEPAIFALSEERADIGILFDTNATQVWAEKSVEPRNSVAKLLEEHELRKDECALGKKLKEYIHSKFKGSDKIEIDIPNIKVTKGSFEHSYRLDVITETILYKHHR